MMLIIAPASEARRVCDAAGPSHLLRLISPGLADDTTGLYADRILTLVMHDVGAPTPGRTAPTPEMVQALLAFSRSWNGDRPLVAQCWAGVSRSTAAAFIIACQKRPDLAERTIAKALRRAAPQATPNRLMLAHADALLGRNGRMLVATEAIGRGAEFAAFASAELDLTRTTDEDVRRFPRDQGLAASVCDNLASTRFRRALKAIG
jgi:predicted protein tyrosine phosphatase